MSDDRFDAHVERLLTRLLSETSSMRETLGKTCAHLEEQSKIQVQAREDIKGLRQDMTEVQRAISRGRGALWVLSVLGGIATFFWAEAYRIFDFFRGSS